LRSSLNPSVLSRITLPAESRKTAPAFVYDIRLDEVLVDMHGRRWDRDETFPPAASKIHHLINGTNLLGNFPDPDEIPYLIVIAETTKSKDLRNRVLAVLRYHLCDVSTDDSTHKAKINELLNTYEKEPDESEI